MKTVDELVKPTHLGSLCARALPLPRDASDSGFFSDENKLSSKSSDAAALAAFVGTVTARVERTLALSLGVVSNVTRGVRDAAVVEVLMSGLWWSLRT